MGLTHSSVFSALFLLLCAAPEKFVAQQNNFIIQNFSNSDLYVSYCYANGRQVLRCEGRNRVRRNKAFVVPQPNMNFYAFGTRVYARVTNSKGGEITWPSVETERFPFFLGNFELRQVRSPDIYEFSWGGNIFGWEGQRNGRLNGLPPKWTLAAYWRPTSGSGRYSVNP